MRASRYRTAEVVVSIRVHDSVTREDLFATSVVERRTDQHGTVAGLRDAVGQAESLAAQQVDRMVKAYGEGRKLRGEA